MPIIENVGGVLRTLSTITTNDSGVIREMDSVHTNDGGVMREIFRANKGATVEGITPLVVAEDHIVIVDSGTFTLSAPAGARIIVGGAAKGTSGGNVAEYTLESDIKNAQCTADISAVNSGGNTTLTIGGTTYTCGTAKQIIQSKWGPIGGEGGNEGCNGTGAGGGGGVQRYDYTNPSNGKGGNNGGYGNFGGNGGHSAAPPYTLIGGDGASGKGGKPSNYYEYSHIGGGGGGYAAGGGVGDYYSSNYEGSPPAGEGGAGIIVIEWDN